MNTFLLILIIWLLLCFLSSWLLTSRSIKKLNENMLYYKRYELKHNFLDQEYKKYLIQNLNASEFYGNCKGGDLSTQIFNPDNVNGFSIIFQKDHLDCVKRQFPYLSKYLDKIILPGTNSYYMNYLVINNGKEVKTHIDDTLYPYFSGSTKKNTNAKYVTVLYLTISPEMIGGELNIEHHRNKLIKRPYNKIKPKENMLVIFDGNLYHSVNEFKSTNHRASLVCEQYYLSDEERKTMKGFIILDQKNNKKLPVCVSSHEE